MKLNKAKYSNRVVMALMIVLFIGLTGCNKEPGFLVRSKPEVTIGANDTRLQSNIIHLKKDTVYVLATNITRTNGQVLSIDAGTLIKVNDKLSITIEQGAVIEANGNADAPIIFTSSASMGGAGSQGVPSSNSRFWYGIRIYGDNQSSSGSMKYMRIEFAGGDDGSALPSLLLNNVSQTTVLENIQVSYSFATCSFGFYGGKVNATNLVSYACLGSDFYIRDGYSGMLQNLLAWRHPYFPANIQVPAQSPFDALAGIFIEGAATFPAISNATVIGPDLRKGPGYYYTNETSSTARVASLVTAAGAKFHIRNSVFLGFPTTAFYMDDLASALSLSNGESDFAYSTIQSEDLAKVFYLPANVYPPFTSEDFKTFVLQSQFDNKLLLRTDDFMITDPYNYDNNPNPLPKAGSTLLTGSNFDLPIFENSFFKKVNFRGAIGTDNWLLNWTNFNPLRTNYNN